MDPGARYRPILLNIFLASIGVNAALGIWALLTDDFGQTQGKILATSFLVSAAMVGVLVNGPALAQRVLWPVPPIAALAATTGFALFIVLVWVELDDEWALKLGFSLLIAAVGGTLVGLLALASLRPRHQVLRVLNEVLVLALCTTSIVVMWAEIDATWVARLLGVLAVLVAALTLTIPALARFRPPTVTVTPGDNAPEFCPTCGQQWPAERVVSGELFGLSDEEHDFGSSDNGVGGVRL